MSGQRRRVKYARPATRNEEAGVVSGAWAPRAGSGAGSPSAFLLLGRDDKEAGRAISVREYNFDSDTLFDTVRVSFSTSHSSHFPTCIANSAMRPWKFPPPVQSGSDSKFVLGVVLGF
jgi:hypothetical protein